MGYFSNGTEGDMYEAEYCVKCRHFNNGDCPVMRAHFLYAYEECDSKSNCENTLSLLIPRRKDAPGNDRCTLFIAKPRRRK